MWSLPSCLSRFEFSLLDTNIFSIHIFLVFNKKKHLNCINNIISTLLHLFKAHEAVIRGQYPAPEETLQFLAALRLQYLLGDFSTQNALPELEQVFPMGRLRARVQQSARTFASGNGSATPSTEKKRGSFLEGTLRRSFRGSLGRQRQVEGPAAIEAWLQDEKAGLISCLVEKWRKLQGMEQEQAMKKYMSLIKEWQGYGSTLFDVEVSTHTCTQNASSFGRNAV